MTDIFCRLLLILFCLGIFGLPVDTHAAVFFAGVGNDGFYQDVVGLQGSLDATGQLAGSFLYEDLSGSGIADSLLSLQEVVGAGDTLFWYYSGHGNWLADGDDWDETAAGSFAVDNLDETVGMQGSSDQLTDDQLASIFQSFASAGTQVVSIMDVCYAGGFIGGLDDLNSVANLVFLGSSGELEDSYRHSGSIHSIFTQGLIDALAADDNGLLIAGMWFDAAYDYTVSQTSRQHPVFWGDSGFVVSPVPVPIPGSMWLLLSGLLGICSIQRLRLTLWWTQLCG